MKVVGEFYGCSAIALLTKRPPRALPSPAPSAWHPCPSRHLPSLITSSLRLSSRRMQGIRGGLGTNVSVSEGGGEGRGQEQGATYSSPGPQRRRDRDCGSVHTPEAQPHLSRAGSPPREHAGRSGASSRALQSQNSPEGDIAHACLGRSRVGGEGGGGRPGRECGGV